MHSITRYHDISCGHRVYGHESKCSQLHGHNYRIHFEVRLSPGVQLDNVGRIVDFSVVKSTLCQWLEDEWDHKFLIWENDPIRYGLEVLDLFSVVVVPFNPTAEGMARFLVETLAPALLENSGVYLHTCVIEETRKCSATYSTDIPK